MRNPKEVITHCVEEFEARTQVELVVSVKKRSESYYSFFWFYTLLLVQFFWISTVLFKDAFDFGILSIESLVLIALSYFVLMRFEVLRYLIPKKIKQANLKKAAGREFYNLGMYNTKRRSGLLIIYSRWEDDCLLVPDKGVQDRISKDELAAFTKLFQDAFRSNDLIEAIGSQIRSFGVYWKTRWPNEDDDNEIVHAFQDDPS